jgi:hypothetical protein
VGSEMCIRDRGYRPTGLGALSVEIRSFTDI